KPCLVYGSHYIQRLVLAKRTQAAAAIRGLRISNAPEQRAAPAELDGEGQATAIAAALPDLATLEHYERRARYTSPAGYAMADVYEHSNRRIPGGNMSRAGRNAPESVPDGIVPAQRRGLEVGASQSAAFRRKGVLGAG